MRSVGEIARHIAIGRFCWFVRMDAPGSAELASSLFEWHTDGDGSRHPVEEQGTPRTGCNSEIGSEASWTMIQATLDARKPGGPGRKPTNTRFVGSHTR